MSMKPLKIFLDEELSEWLEGEAKRTHTSKAAVIRRLILEERFRMKKAEAPATSTLYSPPTKRP